MCTLKVYLCTLTVYFGTLELYFCTPARMFASGCIENHYSKSKEGVVINVHFIEKPPCCWGYHLRLFFSLPVFLSFFFSLPVSLLSSFFLPLFYLRFVQIVDALLAPAAPLSRSNSPTALFFVFAIVDALLSPAVPLSGWVTRKGWEIKKERISTEQS